MRGDFWLTCPFFNSYLFSTIAGEEFRSCLLPVGYAFLRRCIPSLPLIFESYIVEGNHNRRRGFGVTLRQLCFPFVMFVIALRLIEIFHVLPFLLCSRFESHLVKGGAQQLKKGCLSSVELPFDHVCQLQCSSAVVLFHNDFEIVAD